MLCEQYHVHIIPVRVGEAASEIDEEASSRADDTPSISEHSGSAEIA